jgi:hypothetical protein
VLECFFSDEFGELSKHLPEVLSFIVNGYNLLEPEHSNEFPLVKLDIFIPQLFGTRSVLLTDPEITALYFNEQTNMH